VSEAIKVGEALREDLQQATVTVASFVGEHGIKTPAFITETKGDMRVLGKAWQDAAEIYNQQTNIYVTCGLYERPDGSIVLEAESNPKYNVEPEKWREAASAIASEVTKSTGAKLDLTFREAGFTYHHAKGQANSRGIIG